MTDLTNPKSLYLKGGLFLVASLLASVLLLIDHPHLKTAFLVIVAIWCAARAYYFAFYVITHYVDDTYRFSGLWSFARYLRKRQNPDTY
jgi:hypothetical protein